MSDKLSVPERIRRERRAGTPLLLIATPDPKATAQMLWAVFQNGSAPAFLTWNLVAGLRPMTGVTKDAVPILKVATDDQGNPLRGQEALAMAASLCAPDAAMMFARRMAEAAGEDPFVLCAENLIACACDQGPNALIAAQAIRELRDVLKASAGCVLVMLEPDTQLPPLLQDDVVVLDEPYPTRAQLAEMVREVYHAAAEDLEMPPTLKPEVEEEVVRALVGLPAFAAEQAFAPCIDEDCQDGVSVAAVWDRKVQKIRDTPGLDVITGDQTFQTMRGVNALVEYLEEYLEGKPEVQAILFIDEIEKALAASGSEGGADSTGVSQDQLGVLLKWMQERMNKNLLGAILLVGHAGTGKTEIAKATGKAAKVPVIEQDLGGVKSKWLGESEQNLRRGMKVVDATAPDGLVLVICTSNNIRALPPEFQDRFTDGIWMFELPGRQEKDALWTNYCAFYGIPEDEPRPEDEGWSGRNIRECCRRAARGASVGKTGVLLRASRYVVPVIKREPEKIEALRRAADGRYLSAADGGIYVAPKTAGKAPKAKGEEPLTPSLGSARRFSK